MTDAVGKVTYATFMDLSDDYRDGLRRFAARRYRGCGREWRRPAPTARAAITRVRNGVYTAVRPCRDDPKSRRCGRSRVRGIIHDQTDKMLYFRNAQLDSSAFRWLTCRISRSPDPTVKRKTGFLMPAYSNYTTYGYGVETPFYWAIGPI